jgi:TolA protein
MRASLLLSIVLHVLLLGAVLLNFSSRTALKSTRPVSVEILSPSEFSQLKAGKPDVKPESAASQSAPPDKMPEAVPTSAELKAPEKPSRTQAALPPPKPKAAPPPEPDAEAKAASPPKEAKSQPETSSAEAKPSPVPEPEKRAERPRLRAEAAKHAEPAAEPRAEHETRPEPKHRARPAQDRIAELLDKRAQNREGQSDFDPKQIAALLNRDPNAGARPPQQAPRQPWRQPSSLQQQAMGADTEAPRREVYGATQGQGARMSASDIDALRAQISRCWAPPVGGLGSDAIIVKLRIELNQDGSIGRAPEVVNDNPSHFFPPAAESAVRAVFQCAPYRMPPETYAQWHDMLLNFDPSRMYGG